MQIVFSRKGFDSTAGGVPSPIIDGCPVTLPIPTKQSTPTRFCDLQNGAGQLVVDLTQSRISAEGSCHVDPDIDDRLLSRQAGWRGAFGQAGACNLANRNVGPGVGWLYMTRRSSENGVRYRIVGCIDEGDGRQLITAVVQGGLHMMRLIAMLALAGVSFATAAAPPITGPVEVTVANEDPIPVTIEAPVPFSAREGVGAPGAFTEIEIDIPDGKRLIIETVAAFAEIPPGTSIVFYMLPWVVADGSAPYGVVPIPVVSQGVIPDGSGSPHQVYAGLHSVRVSADAIGSTSNDLIIQSRRSQVSGEVITNTSYTVTVYGYLVDL